MTTVIDNDRSFGFWKDISAGSSDYADYSIPVPNGECWEIYRVMTSVPNDAASKAMVKFDAETLFTAYSDRDVIISKKIMGDGVKKLRIELVNSLAITTNMGLDFGCRRCVS